MVLDGGIDVSRLPLVEGATDPRGNPVTTWGPPELVPNVAFDPGSTSEPRLPGHDRVVVEPTLYARDRVLPFQPRDRVDVLGTVYTVEGVVRVWRDPYSGALRGSVVSLKAVTG